MTATTDIVQKFWNLCYVLLDDGYHLPARCHRAAYLPFLKMMQQTGQEGQLPEIIARGL